MGKNLTTEEFISKAKLIHGDKYDYGKVNYINTLTKINIICPIHGIFEQIPNYHLSGCGCKKCGLDKVKKNNKQSLKDFIDRVNEIHKGKYNYSKVKYKNAHSKVIITCPEHGEFEQLPHNHINGKGCSLCAGMDRNITTEKMIIKFNNKHNHKYNYCLSNYKNNQTKIKIMCKNHGEFEQTPAAHLKGQGCPVCKESKGEAEIKKFLFRNNIKFTQQYRFNDCVNIKPLPFDFYLPDYNTCIEFNGKQHYISIAYWGGDKSLLLQQRRDKIKMEYCRDNNIPLMVIKYDENVIEKLDDLFNRVTIVT